MKIFTTTIVTVLLIAAAFASSGCSQKYECRKFCQGSPVGTISTDMEGAILFTNPALQKMLGYSSTELKGMTYQALTPDKWEGMEKSYIDAAKELALVRFEKEFTRKDGKIVPVEITGWLIRDGSGKSVGTANLVVDLTDYVDDRNIEQIILPD